MSILTLSAYFPVNFVALGGSSPATSSAQVCAEAPIRFSSPAARNVVDFYSPMNGRVSKFPFHSTLRPCFSSTGIIVSFMSSTESFL